MSMELISNAAVLALPSESHVNHVLTRTSTSEFAPRNVCPIGISRLN